MKFPYKKYYNINEFKNDYIKSLSSTFNSINTKSLSRIVKLLENAYKKKPKIKLHKDYDGTHPDILGTYLAACVVFASITHRSPFEIKYDYYGKVSKSDKSFLQSIAHKTVEDFYSIKLK